MVRFVQLVRVLGVVRVLEVVTGEVIWVIGVAEMVRFVQVVRVIGVVHKHFRKIGLA